MLSLLQPRVHAERSLLMYTPSSTRLVATEEFAIYGLRACYSLTCFPNESDTVVALWSKNAKASAWCPQELAYARERQSKGLNPHRIVFISVDDTKPPLQFTGFLRLMGKDRVQRELAVMRLLKEEK